MSEKIFLFQIIGKCLLRSILGALAQHCCLFFARIRRVFQNHIYFPPLSVPLSFCSPYFLSLPLCLSFLPRHAWVLHGFSLSRHGKAVVAHGWPLALLAFIYIVNQSSCKGYRNFYQPTQCKTDLILHVRIVVEKKGREMDNYRSMRHPLSSLMAVKTFSLNPSNCSVREAPLYPFQFIVQDTKTCWGEGPCPPSVRSGPSVQAFHSLWPKVCTWTDSIRGTERNRKAMIIFHEEG